MNGIIRRFDDLGRVVIPKEIREKMGWNEGAAVEIYVDRDGKVVLESAGEGECVFCHAPTGEEFMGIAVCKKCREGLKNV